jgi:hypothetical protein
MAENQQRLEKNQPAPQITFSNERANIIKRASTFGNDPNKVSYIYLLTDNGQVIAFYTVKGKVSNVSSYLVPDQNVVHGVAIQAPDIDGSYGTNGDGIFFYTTDNTYVEWSGQYLLCDQPLKISSPPVLTMEVKR